MVDVGSAWLDGKFLAEPVYNVEVRFTQPLIIRCFPFFPDNLTFVPQLWSHSNLNLLCQLIIAILRDLTSTLLPVCAWLAIFSIGTRPKAFNQIAEPLVLRSAFILPRSNSVMQEQWTRNCEMVEANFFRTTANYSASDRRYVQFRMKWFKSLKSINCVTMQVILGQVSPSGESMFVPYLTVMYSDRNLLIPIGTIQWYWICYNTANR